MQNELQGPDYAETTDDGSNGTDEADSDIEAHDAVHTETCHEDTTNTVALTDSDFGAEGQGLKITEHFVKELAAHVMALRIST